METFNPSIFFDLNNCDFRFIFEGCTHVWDVLPKIKEFLLSQKLGKIKGTVSNQAYLINPEMISIDEGSVVEPGAYIKGPCSIGRNCTIRQGAYIRGQLIMGDGCVIGHGTEVKNTILLNDAKAAHFNYLGDSLLGNNVNLGAGTKCANLRLNREFITIHLKNEIIQTGLKKFGAIFGDGSQTGCNCVTNPGTIFGKNVLCHPCLNPRGYVAPNQVISSDIQLNLKKSTSFSC